MGWIRGLLQNKKWPCPLPQKRTRQTRFRGAIPQALWVQIEARNVSAGFLGDVFSGEGGPDAMV